MDTSLWMARDLVTVTPDTPLHVASRRMADRRVRHLLVVDANDPQRLVGLFSSHDLFLAAESGVNPFSPVAAQRTTERVGDVMTRHPCAIAPTTPLTEAARLLRDKKFGCLPVVDRGVLVGILTEHDILRAFLRTTGAEQTGCEVTCVVPDGADVLVEFGKLAALGGLQLSSASVFLHDGRRLCVLHLAGDCDEAFVDLLWRSGHKILRVRPTGKAAPAHAGS